MRVSHNNIGIYIHIPFCLKKCPYCDFNSIKIADVSDDVYIRALLDELSSRITARPALSGKRLDTIYIGGGTPSLIPPDNIERLICGIRQTFKDGDNPEVTLEVNPGTVSRGRLAGYKHAGVNRLSIGVQSFNEQRLGALGRIHTVRESVDCFEAAAAIGFDNIGIDLIFGTPGQSLSEWKADLHRALSMQPKHISVYSLSIEDGTPFFSLMKSGKLTLPMEEDVVIMYELAIDMLKDAGYIHYEISNFSFRGFESRHNTRYWRGLDYIGLGAGAHSYLSSPRWGTRWWNERDVSLYLRHIKECGRAVAGAEELEHGEAVTEAVFLGLRQMKGIDCRVFRERFHISLQGQYGEKITMLMHGGFLNVSDNTLSLTRKGILVSNEIFTEFVR